MFLLQLPGVTFSNNQLPNPTAADALLVNSQGGVKVLFDLSSAAGYPSQTNPIQGVAVTDLTGGTNLFANVAGTTPPTFVGGGFDFTGATSAPNTVEASASVLSSIWGAANQYFLACGYFKLPSLADWNPQSSLMPFFASTGNGNITGYSTEADLVTIGAGSTHVITARRQTDGGNSHDTIDINLATGHYGQVAQIAFWRNASGQGLRVKSTAGGVQTGTTTVGVNNTGNFGGKAPKWGVTRAFAQMPDTGSNERLYRGFIEDLSVSGRTPTTVLDADWTASVGRFS